MRSTSLGLALWALTIAMSSPASASPITYNVKDTAESLIYTGTITTDGKVGILGAADIQNWDLTIDGFGAPQVLTPANSVVHSDGASLLSASSTHLAWIFSDQIGNEQSDFYFKLGPSNFVLDEIFYEQASGIDTGVFSIDEQNAISGSTTTVDLPPSDVFGNASTPEPSTWAMMILGLGAVGVVLRRRRNIDLAAA